jgi:hypothetical protein
MAEGAAVSSELAAAMQTLYAAGPDAFMTVRRGLVAEARAAGGTDLATDIGRLRKPSVAAWSVNLVARARPDLVADLVELGVRMRAAQSHLDTATLTALRPDRDALLLAFESAAASSAQEAGRRLPTAGRQEVRATVVAALADEAATQAVVSGQLTRALSYSGFGEVDLSEAVARTSSGSILTVLPGRVADARVPVGVGAAEPVPGRSLEAAQGALASADARLAAAEATVAAAREHAEDTRERLAVVERQLQKAREADERALEAVTEAVRSRKQAEAARHTAARALADAQSGS